MGQFHTMVTTPNHIRPAGQGRTMQVLGTSVVYKADAAETCGQFLCAEITVPPGEGVPPHRHTHEDEAFYVLAGSVLIEGDDCGEGGATLAAGGFFFGPRGRVHGFRCAGETAAKLLVFISPGDGMGQVFSRLSELSHSQHGQGIEPAAVAGICQQFGIEFCPAP